MKYGFCLNHPNKRARNAKRLCDTCTKERHKNSAESKGLTIKKKEDGADNTRRNFGFDSIQKTDGRSGKPQIQLHVQNTISKKKTKIKPRSDKNKELVKQELLVFKKIWESRPHFCEVTGKPIHAFDVRCFSHVLTKGAYPRFRLYDKNIVLCLPEVHFEWEFKTRKTLELSWIETLESALKYEYYGTKTKTS